MDPFRIFIVEDDLLYAKILGHHLAHNPDYEVEVFTNGKDLVNNLYKNPSVISLDYNLPGMSGLEVLKRIKEHNSELPVIVVSGQQDVSTAIELLKKGAYDYVIKDQDTKERLWNLMRNIRENYSLKQKITVLEEEIGKKSGRSEECENDTHKSLRMNESLYSAMLPADGTIRGKVQLFLTCFVHCKALADGHWFVVATFIIVYYA